MAQSPFSTDGSYAAALDAADELASFRRRFHIPGSGNRAAAYLCGQSLGLMPKRAESALLRELQRWRNSAVEGHFAKDGGWLAYHERLTQPLARLAGARAAEVVAMNSLTVNLHLMLVSFFRPTRQRSAVVIEAGAFPSDRYAVASQLAFHGLDPESSLIELEGATSPTGLTPARLEALLDSRGDSVALVLLPGVHYLTGEALDIGGLTAVAHRYGCAVGFDLAHAIGNVPLALHAAGPDFAVWCSYKYLNGGPGAIGGCFVHERHGEAFDLPRFAGWWGHDKSRRFRMESEFRALVGAEGWQLSNPPIFAMAPLEVSLAIFDEARMSRLRRKSLLLTNYMERLIRRQLRGSVEIITPAERRRRGAQLSLKLQNGNSAAAIAKRLRAQHVVVDVREPDILRVAPVPLYNSFKDVFRFVTALRQSV